MLARIKKSLFSTSFCNIKGNHHLRLTKHSKIQQIASKLRNIKQDFKHPVATYLNHLLPPNYHLQWVEACDNDYSRSEKFLPNAHEKTSNKTKNHITFSLYILIIIIILILIVSFRAGGDGTSAQDELLSISFAHLIENLKFPIYWIAVKT